MLYQQIARNKCETASLLVISAIILALVGGGLGYLINGEPLSGIVIALAGSLIYLFIVFQNPGNLVMDMSHDREIREEDDPELWRVAEDMTPVGRIPTPKVFTINDESPNAPAIGHDPKYSFIAVATGLRKWLNQNESEGVLDHEISHIRNCDVLVSTIGVASAAVISFISSFASHTWWWGGNSDRDDDDFGSLGIIFRVVVIVFTLISGPLAAALAQMAFSRNHEHLADASSAEFTKGPQGLTPALERISNSEPMRDPGSSSAGLYTENLFYKCGLSSLFGIYPPTADRVKRLEDI